MFIIINLWSLIYDTTGCKNIISIACDFKDRFFVIIFGDSEMDVQHFFDEDKRIRN